MNTTKIAAVLLGAGAGLIGGAPLAFAGDMPSHDSGDHGHHATHEGHGDHHGKRGGGDTCSVGGGSAGAENPVDGDALLGNIIAQVPVGGLNAANLTCNSVLNHNLNGNELGLDLL
ncbi:hypothetical protein [Actinomycetospora soli]|uniref:hypothetical protein n=1 Tax=Actinomycetospora soli TaxID=2893887 RepID=UPI001E557BBB|nr:hypothetical protein [Actinomycetospora soli]MCD2186331.1 hypothetical protein [Actinomycetospora soli]